MDLILKFRNLITSFLYRAIARPLFFLMDAEDIHEKMIVFGNFLGKHWISRIKTRVWFNYQNQILEQIILGIKFKNPVGLAAGFDKDGYLTRILPETGFGFMEIGSITGEPCAGNPRPWMWRLVKTKSMIVNYGLKNEGCEKVAKRLSEIKCAIPLGISLAKTNSPDTVDLQKGIEDYLKVYRIFVKVGVGDYFTINIGCPNAYGGEPFVEPKKLEKLLQALRQIPSTKPVFIKMSPDIEPAKLDSILDLADKYQISGFICTNLTKNRENIRILDKNLPPQGGLSGKVLEELSNGQIRHIYNKTRGKNVIIGCGGVFSAEDAYKKIKLGASLVQQVTGMIFQGPQLISDINLGLVNLLKRDGLKNISQAIGIENRGSR